MGRERGRQAVSVTGEGLEPSRAGREARVAEAQKGGLQTLFFFLTPKEEPRKGLKKRVTL